MSASRRRWVAISASAAIAGLGFGLFVGQFGPRLAPGLDISITVLGLGALLATLVAGPRGSLDPSTSTEDVGWTEFRRELRRSRRGIRPLTLLRISGDQLHGDGGDLGARSRQLGQHLRLVDRTWVDDGSIYVLLPESSRDAANVLIDRIRAQAPGELPDQVRVASFPEDGLTGGAIIAAVHDGALDSVPIPIHQRLAEHADQADLGERRVVDAGEGAAFAIDELAVGDAART